MTPEEQYRFDQFRYGLHQATPRAFVAKIVVVMNVIVYLAMVATGYDPINSDTPQSMVMLFDWGANYGPFTVDGEWWRLLTCAFLHGPIYHIGINMWVLWTEGPLVERMLGNAGFAVLYIVSALAGSVASIAVRADVLSVGASGAIFGVIGALAAQLYQHRHALPSKVRNSLLRSGLLFIGLNVVFALEMSQIDWAAHVGGLVAGAVCGAVMGHPFTPAGVRGRTRRNGIVALVGALAVVGGAWALPSDVNVLKRGVDTLAASRFAAVLGPCADRFRNTTEVRVIDVTRCLKREGIPIAAVARVVEEKIIPGYVSLAERAKGAGAEGLDLLAQEQATAWKRDLAKLGGASLPATPDPEPRAPSDPRTEDPRGR